MRALLSICEFISCTTGIGILLLLGLHREWPLVAAPYIQLLLTLGCWLLIEHEIERLRRGVQQKARRRLLILGTLLTSALFALLVHSMQSALQHLPWAFAVFIATLGFRGLARGAAQRKAPWIVVVCLFLSHMGLAAVSAVLVVGTWDWLVVPLALGAGCLSTATILVRDAFGTQSTNPFTAAPPLVRQRLARCYTLCMLLPAVVPGLLALVGLFPPMLWAMLLLTHIASWIGERLEFDSTVNVTRPHLYACALIATLFVLLGIA